MKTEEDYAYDTYFKEFHLYLDLVEPTLLKAPEKFSKTYLNRYVTVFHSYLKSNSIKIDIQTFIVNVMGNPGSKISIVGVYTRNYNDKKNSVISPLEYCSTVFNKIFKKNFNTASIISALLFKENMMNNISKANLIAVLNYVFFQYPKVLPNNRIYFEELNLKHSYLKEVFTITNFVNWEPIFYINGVLHTTSYENMIKFILFNEPENREEIIDYVKETFAQNANDIDKYIKIEGEDDFMLNDRDSFFNFIKAIILNNASALYSMVFHNLEVSRNMSLYESSNFKESLKFATKMQKINKISNYDLALRINSSISLIYHYRSSLNKNTKEDKEKFRFQAAYLEAFRNYMTNPPE